MVQSQANLTNQNIKVSVVDGACGDDNIAELWASKLKYLLHSNSSCGGDLSLSVCSKISSNLSYMFLIWMFVRLYKD